MAQETKSRRELEEQTRRDHILNITEQLFAKQGLHDTSVADIAREAEFGVGTIYKYFKDKNTLIQSLLEDRLNAHFDEITQAMTSEGSPVHRLDALIEAYFTSVNQRRAFFVVYHTHFHPGPKSQQNGPINLEFCAEWKMSALEGIQALFEEGIACGQIINIDPDYLTAALFGMLIAFSFTAERKFENEWNVQEMRNALKRIFFDQVLGDARPKPLAAVSNSDSDSDSDKIGDLA